MKKSPALLTLFKKAEASDFLKGKNGRDWQATFDWLIKDNNMAKVLEGNYDNKCNKTSNVTQEQIDSYMQQNAQSNMQLVENDNSYF